MDIIYDNFKYYDVRKAGCDICLEDNWFLVFFFLISFIPITGVLAMWVVGKFVYQPHLKYLNNIPDFVEKIKETPYEDLYPLENAKSNNKDINTMICNVCEMTPEGNVFLRYNKEDECFDYWCDEKSVSYKYLETVARKYVTIFHCADFYIDRQQDIDDQIQRAEEKKRIEEEKAQMSKEDKEYSDSDDDVFAKLKPKAHKRNKKLNIKAAINANRYRYRGKTCEFIKQKEKKDSKNPKKKMGFDDWKILCKE